MNKYFSSCFYCILIITVLNNFIILGNFYHQEIEVKVVDDRLALFHDLLVGKKVLHVGCTDFPIFNPSTNLHLILAKFLPDIEGYDIDVEGLKCLKSHFNGEYYSRIADIRKHYDVVLIPETIEHVGNVENFLHELDNISTSYFIVTAPNAYCHINALVTNSSQFNIMHCFLNKTKTLFTEEVHPDHNYYFSPYTLKNCICKYTKWAIEEIFLVEKETMVVLVCKK